MNAIEEAAHLLVGFRQLDGDGRARVVRHMKARALRILAPHLPVGFNADDHDECVILSISVRRSQIPANAKAAARLLGACVNALEAPTVFDAGSLVLAYAQLDMHAVDRDAATQAGRSQGGKDKAAKLPPVDELRAMVEQVRAARNVSEADAKGIVSKRYRATRQAINRKLKKT